MKVLFSRSSQNGRWGLEIASSTIESLPARGTLGCRGEVAGRRCYVATADEDAPWILAFDASVEVVEGTGATLVCEMSLQGGRYVSLVLAHEGAIVKRYGYKGRSSRYCILGPEGHLETVPPVLLAAAGLAGGDPFPVEAPPEASGAFAEALREAGII